MIKVKIVKDSIAPSEVRLTTFVLTYPRFIHSEFMTHRMFSRNASSSRAIPVKKQIEMVEKNPVIPIAFTKNQKGMQGGEALTGQEHQEAVYTWLRARDKAVEMAKQLADLEVHKQYANRILEPFAHITVVCTATDFNNFFALRMHSAAQPEIQHLAALMWEAYSLNQPQKLEEGQWHLPFVDDEILSSEIVTSLDDEKTDEEGWSAQLNYGYKYDDTLVKCSVARCARVSYLNHEGKKPSLEEDLALYDRLLGQVPIHASPAEHQAMVESFSKSSGNFGEGWIQYRKTLEHENITEFNGPEDK